MKKWLMFCLTLLIVITLTACSPDDKGETVTLLLEKGGSTSKIVYSAEGDKVIEQTSENVLTYDTLGVSNQEEAEAVLGKFVIDYEGIEGVSHNIEYHDDQVIESTKVNFEKADPDQIAELTGAITEGNTGNGVSLEKSIEVLESQGYEVVTE
ncbi:YehR family lipoprotein [Gracilibacillus salitolerans]|nr:YehR family protein [Gracilibacillus salitolerans]